MSSIPNQPLQIPQGQFGNPVQPKKPPIVKILIAVFAASFVLAGLFVAVIFMLVDTLFHANGGYILAMKTAEESPCVVAAIGTPLKSHWMITGNTNESGDMGNAMLSVPVRGPKGDGKMEMEAKKFAGKWAIESLSLVTNGHEIQIVPADPTANCK